MRRLALLLIIIAGLLAGCGDTPAYDPYAAQKAALTWQQEQDAAARWALLAGVATWGLVLGGAALGGIGLYWLAGRAWWNVRAAAKDVQLTAPDPQGQWPAPTWALLADPTLAALANQRRARVALTAAAASRHAALTHYHNERHVLPPGAVPVLEPGDSPVPQPPGPFTFAAVRGRGFQPTPQQTYLASAAGDTPLLVAPGANPHQLITGPTGEGKTNTIRLLLGQYLAAGLICHWLNPHPLQWEERDRTDWRPIIAALRTPPHQIVTRLDAITAYLAWLIDDELDARIRRGEVGHPLGPLINIFVDEWPAILAHDKRNEHYYSRLVREGRKYGLLLTMAAQDALVKTLGGSSGVREQFGVLYYYGGNQYTRQALEIPDTLLDLQGVGRAAVRVGSRGAWTLAQVPLMDNTSLYELLGWPSAPPPWGWDSPPRQSFPAAVIEGQFHTVPASVPAPWEVDPERGEAPGGAAPATAATAATAETAATDGTGWPEMPENARRAIQSLQSGQSLPDAIEAAYGVSRRNPNKYGPAYEEVQAALRGLVPPVPTSPAKGV